jgi:hypothetical protein
MRIDGVLRRSGWRSLAVVALGLSGCGPMGPLGAKASDTWTHTYPLNKTGEVTIVNANGRIDVEGVDGSTLEVQAERIASGATEQLARDLLPRIPIEEHATPDFVSIETRRLSGFLIGASYEVRYKVKIPRTATIRATTVNGAVTRANDEWRGPGDRDRRRAGGPDGEWRRQGAVRVAQRRSGRVEDGQRRRACGVA